MYVATMALATAYPAYGSEWPPGDRLAILRKPALKDPRRTLSSRPEQELYLGEVRDAAMPRGVVCPHCSSTQVVRYGKRRGVQRYMCNACVRTFSDFTGTVLHGLRRRELWLEFSKCLAEGISVRATARRLGVAKNTAFDWRHRAMAALSAADCVDTCEGVVEVMQRSIVHSFKGSKVPQEAQLNHLRPTVRRYHLGHAHLFPPRRLATMVVAVDRAGRARAAVIARGENLTPTLLTMASASATICASRRYGRLQLKADWPGRIHWLDRNHNECGRAGRASRRSQYHLRNAYRLMYHFHEWLARFLGVASKYLVRYFAWYLRYAALILTQPDAAAKLLLIEVLRQRRT